MKINRILNLLGCSLGVICLVMNAIVIQYADEIYNDGNTDLSSPELVAIKAGVGVILGMSAIFAFTAAE